MKKDIYIKNNILMLSMLIITFLAYLFSNIYSIFNNISVILNLIFIITIFLINKNEFKNKKRKIIVIYFLQIIILALTYIFKHTGLGSVLNMLCVTSILIISPEIKISVKVEKILKYIIPIYYLIFIIINKSHLNTNYVGYIFICLYIYLLYQFIICIKKII